MSLLGGDLYLDSIPTMRGLRAYRQNFKDVFFRYESWQAAGAQDPFNPIVEDENLDIIRHRVVAVNQCVYNYFPESFGLDTTSLLDPQWSIH